MADLKEKKRKRALIVFQIVIYGYLLTMFLIQLYMSFARGWWNLKHRQHWGGEARAKPAPRQRISRITTTSPVLRSAGQTSG